MSPSPLIDRAVLDELLASIGEEGTRSVIDLFIDESRAYLATIAEAAAAPGDAARRDRARRAAHSLKSGAGQIGAASMAELAAAVERAASDRAADLAQTTAILQKCAAETLIAFTQLLAED
jgi:HPt (histidine-containing phosphotransfer) domain-containing protein